MLTVDRWLFFSVTGKRLFVATERREEKQKSLDR